MDTSDSEAFESADENFDQENENQKISSKVTSSSSSSEQNIPSVISKEVDSPTNTQPEVNTLNEIENELKCDVEVTDDGKEVKKCHKVVKKSGCDFDEKCDELLETKNDIDISNKKNNSQDFIAKEQQTIILEKNVETPIEENVEEKSELIKNQKYNLLPNVEQESMESGWDDDVEWTPIEPDTVSKESLTEVTETSWNDFDSWDDPDDNNQEKPEEKNVTSLLEKLSLKTETKEDKLWGSWGSWGVASLLSTATEGVTTLTSQVSQGLTTVLESSIGVPSPEELAKAQTMKEKLKEEKSEEVTEPKESPEEKKSEVPLGGFGLGNLITGVSQITKLVETTGSKVVNTGLDTLEVIGKKTMEVLQEGDPGLVKKRQLLGLNPEKPCLSQVLREAKEKAENEDLSYEKQSTFTRKVHFESLFDDYQGLVHLEALEMLSKQCDIKLCTIVETMDENTLKDFQETMLQVKELCELPDEEEDEQTNIDELKTKLNTAVDELGVQITFKKLFSFWEEAENEMKLLDNENDVHRKAIETLAQLTSIAVEQFHKCAELLLIRNRRSTADEADSLVQITTSLTSIIGVVAAKFSEKLDSFAFTSDNPDLNGLITNVFYEATQSSSYIQDAFQLFVPILQIGAV